MVAMRAVFEYASRSDRASRDHRDRGHSRGELGGGTAADEQPDRAFAHVASEKRRAIGQ
jgi:hypothetical protein